MPCHASCFFHGAIKTCIELQTQTDKKGGKLFESNSKEKEKQHPNNRVAKKQIRFVGCKATISSIVSKVT